VLNRLCDEGKVRFIGFTSNENMWPCLGMITSGCFDMCQLQYNLINQAAAYYALPAAQEHDLGVTVMRPLTSGALFDIVTNLAPEWHEQRSVYEGALKFLLSASRIHMVNTGMRWRREVEMNVAIVDAFEPSMDIADLARSVSKRYRKEDSRQ
jgi:predicted aldo/keto reductase-like oxidoreductase